MSSCSLGSLLSYCILFYYTVWVSSLNYCAMWLSFTFDRNIWLSSLSTVLCGHLPSIPSVSYICLVLYSEVVIYIPIALCGCHHYLPCSVVMSPIFSVHSVDVMYIYHILWLSSIFSLYVDDVIYSYHIVVVMYNIVIAFCGCHLYLCRIRILGLLCLSSTVCRGCQAELSSTVF